MADRTLAPIYCFVDKREQERERATESGGTGLGSFRETQFTDSSSVLVSDVTYHNLQ